MTRTTAPHVRIDAADEDAMEAFGDRFWLNELHPIMGMENYQAIIGTVIRDDPGPLPEARLRAVRIDGVDRLGVRTGVDCGCSPEKAVILTLDAPGELAGDVLMEAVWAGYMLSLKATMDGGRNPRAHVGPERLGAVAHAEAIVARLGATATPCDEVYGSGGTYLEALGFEYDPATRTLAVEPHIGS